MLSLIDKFAQTFLLMIYLFSNLQGAKFEILSEEEVLRRHALEKERQIAKSERLAKRREKKKLKNGISHFKQV